jgi:hypothetical protein
MPIIYLDIETLPAQAGWVRDDLASTIKAPATYKKAESIAEWERENKPGAIDEAWLKTSFDGGVGQILCVSWAADDSDPQLLGAWEFGDAMSTDAEREMLATWFDALRRISAGTSGMRPVVCGHNVAAFDLPFVWKRAIVLGVVPPLWLPRNPKPWSESIFDTMTQWAGDRDRISLDRLCKVLGIEGKGDGPTGADVWPMAQEGRFDEIGKYCMQDVERARSIARRLKFEAA